MAGTGAGGLGIVLGTRPEIIKMAPVVRAAQAAGTPFSIIHTGQHYSDDMDAIFFRQLGLAPPSVRLESVPGGGATRHGAQTGHLLAGLERVFSEIRPAVVLVEGDTNTVLAGALAGVKMGIPVGHVEAGLRSGDRRMPEEINRILVDHCSDLLFAPTEESAKNLRAEGLPEHRIVVTGNTIVDAVNEHLALAEKDSRIMGTLGLVPRQYGVVTLHRQENVDDARVFGQILEGLAGLPIPLIYPIHPRSRQMAATHGLGRYLDAGSGIRAIDPLGYLDFLTLLANARIVLTDSGGLQEESCILRVPCLTLRENTERPETVAAGANRVVGVATAGIRDAALDVLEHPAVEQRMRSARNPFGDGKSGQRIVDECRRRWLDGT